MKSDLRSSLGGENLQNHLYVNFNMPPVADYNVRPAVLFWIKEKERRIKSDPPTKHSEWFTGVFSEADSKWREIVKKGETE